VNAKQVEANKFHDIKIWKIKFVKKKTAIFLYSRYFPLSLRALAYQIRHALPDVVRRRIWRRVQRLEIPDRVFDEQNLR
jgi:hypothetical protein